VKSGGPRNSLDFDPASEIPERPFTMSESSSLASSGPVSNHLHESFAAREHLNYDGESILEPRKKSLGPCIRKSDPNDGGSAVLTTFALREIVVFCQQDRALPQRVVPDVGVRRGAEPAFTDMLSLKIPSGAPSRQSGRQLRVNQETHQATCSTGWSA
jgi:hypothetical protein